MRDVNVREESSITVELNQRCKPRTLADLKRFVDECYENGFTGEDTPMIDGHLYYTASMWRRR